MALARGGHKVQCNKLMPGAINTQLATEWVNSESSRKGFETEIAFKKVREDSEVREVREVPDPAVFLADDAMGSFVTGAGLPADVEILTYMQRANSSCFHHNLLQVIVVCFESRWKKELMQSDVVHWTAVGDGTRGSLTFDHSLMPMRFRLHQLNSSGLVQYSGIQCHSHQA